VSRTEDAEPMIVLFIKASLILSCLTCQGS
jgi:hypothetical protein